MFEETLDLKSQLIKRDGQIIDLSPVKVKGLMSVDKGDTCCTIKWKRR